MLSKSKILRGLQCKKSLWLYTHHYDWQDQVSTAQQAIFDTGHTVGALAQQLWPGGIDASAGEPYPNRKCAKRTAELIEQGVEVIYEATFIYDNILVAVDILALENGIWNAYEVKSSTSVKNVNLDDATSQYYVLKGAGIDLENISIVHINNQYVRQKKLDIRELFVIENVTDYAVAYQEHMSEVIEELNDIVKSKEMPEIEIGPHCSDPYQCSYFGHCWKHIPEYSIFNISRINANKAFDWYKNGIIELSDIPEHFSLSEHQQLQVDVELSQNKIIDKDGLNSFIATLNYPIYYLDFETINPAIPMFEGMHPYENIPFQYSLHIRHKETSSYIHKEFLAETNGEDCREMFIKRMIEDCGDKGDILVYNVAFEKKIIQNAMQSFPEYEQPLTEIINRLKDLMMVFQKKMYYTPEMRGKYSIKNVLPALVPELSYDELEINEGGSASAIFDSYFVSVHQVPEEIRKALLDYCKMDTWAMVKILEKIEYVIRH